jgi:hypothetical protein
MLAIENHTCVSQAIDLCTGIKDLLKVITHSQLQYNERHDRACAVP